jgi:hypothetical protein
MNDRPKCETCGEPFYWLGGWKADEYCRNGHPPRGRRVVSGAPPWLRGYLNEAFPREVREFMSRSYGINRTRLGSKYEAWSFLESSNPEFRYLWDHWGHTGDRLVTEPYASRESLERTASRFAERLGLNYSILLPTWHAPWLNSLRGVGPLRAEFSRKNL